jgi:hypothetical protein
MCSMHCNRASASVPLACAEIEYKLLQSFATLPSADTCGAAANDYLGSSAATAQLHTMLQEENGFTAQVGAPQY